MTIVEACSITIDIVHDYTAILTAVQVYSIVVHLRTHFYFFSLLFVALISLWYSSNS